MCYPPTRHRRHDTPVYDRRSPRRSDFLLSEPSFCQGGWREPLESLKHFAETFFGGGGGVDDVPSLGLRGIVARSKSGFEMGIRDL